MWLKQKGRYRTDFFIYFEVQTKRLNIRTAPELKDRTHVNMFCKTSIYAIFMVAGKKQQSRPTFRETNWLFSVNSFCCFSKSRINSLGQRLEWGLAWKYARQSSRPRWSPSSHQFGSSCIGWWIPVDCVNSITNSSVVPLRGCHCQSKSHHHFSPLCVQRNEPINKPILVASYRRWFEYHSAIVSSIYHKCHSHFSASSIQSRTGYQWHSRSPGKWWRLRIFHCDHIIDWPFFN